MEFSQIEFLAARSFTENSVILYGAPFPHDLEFSAAPGIDLPPRSYGPRLQYERHRDFEGL